MSPEFYMELAASTNSLQHHGVEGQKWGKRNGPPYPLDSAGRAKLENQRDRLISTASIQEVNVAPNMGKALGMSAGTLAALGFNAVAGMPSLFAAPIAAVGATGALIYLGRAACNKAVAHSTFKKAQKIQDELDADTKFKEENGQKKITDYNNRPPLSDAQRKLNTEALYKTYGKKNIQKIILEEAQNGNYIDEADAAEIIDLNKKYGKI